MNLIYQLVSNPSLVELMVLVVMLVVLLWLRADVRALVAARIERRRPWFWPRRPKQLRPSPESAAARGCQSTMANRRRTFVVDSLLLAVIWRYVCAQGENEVFHFVGGSRIAPDRYMLTHLVPVAHELQSRSGATADAVSSIWALGELSDWGLMVVAHCHSHPGPGLEWTHPSSLDRRFVAGLAAGCYQAVGLIASRDGYLRFYADETMPFDVQVIGKRIEEVTTNVFKLDNAVAERDLPVCVPRTLVRPQSERSGSPRPAPRL